MGISTNHGFIKEMFSQGKHFGSLLKIAFVSLVADLENAFEQQKAQKQTAPSNSPGLG